MKWSAIVFALMMTSACLSKAPRVVYYDLHTRAVPRQCTSEGGTVVAITPFDASASAGGAQLIMRSDRGQLEPYLYHRWQAPVTQLVAELFAETLASSGQFGNVAQGSVPADTDLVISGRIERFEGVRVDDRRSIARAVIDLSITDLSRPSAPPVARRFAVELPITERSIDALVLALRNAVIRIARDVTPVLAELGGPNPGDRRQCTGPTNGASATRYW